jgi:hypothetical protein
MAVKGKTALDIYVLWQIVPRQLCRSIFAPASLPQHLYPGILAAVSTPM